MILASSSLRRGHLRKGGLRGFTLIELLVVIAIIGILSAVVLASLNTARAKGTDASIKSDLNTVQTQAALDYDAYPNGYTAPATIVGLPAAGSAVKTWTTTGCVAAGGVGVSPFGATTGCDLTAATALNQAASVTGGGIQVGYNAASYIVVAALTATSGTYWCVDSTGNAKLEPSAVPAAATVCP